MCTGRYALCYINVNEIQMRQLSWMEWTKWRDMGPNAYAKQKIMLPNPKPQPQTQKSVSHHCCFSVPFRPDTQGWYIHKRTQSLSLSFSFQAKDIEIR